jgi:glutamate--cysteine ligase catalytic subunit
MGYLTDGTPMAWEDALPVLRYVREHGVVQFINIFNRSKGRANDPFLWGDEVSARIARSTTPPR